jgi:hypothetical protein
MDKSIEETKQYLQAYPQYFYRWEDGGTVLAIPAGRTICYASYVSEALDAMKAAGGPRLGTLLLAIIATAPDSREMLAQVEAIVTKGIAMLNDGNAAIGGFNDAFDFLRMLELISPYFKTGSGRLQLLSVLFADSHNHIGPRKLARIARIWRETPEPESLLQEGGLSMDVIYSHLLPLEYLKRKYPNAQALEVALATVPALPETEIVPELSVAEKAAPVDFVDQLIASPETFTVGALVRRIWSGLRIPLHSSHPSLQPLGGVSDITNRGPLDRLLISEHANDDDRFLSRVANGEALFVRREIPPEPEHRERIILIDSSLQSWGTPRALAYAILIAIARHPKTDIECSAFAIGRDARSILFDTVAQLAESLLLLDPAAGPARGLEAFFTGHSLRPDQEVIFICAPQSYAQYDVQAAISRQLRQIGYCITADAAGAIRVLRKTPQGLALLQEFSLPLDELWKSPPAPQQPEKRQKPERTAQTQGGVREPMPRDYPILFAYPDRPGKRVQAQDGYEYLVTSNGTLLALPDLRDSPNGSASYMGCRILFDNLPTGDCIYRAGVDEDGNRMFVAYSITRRELVVLNLSTNAFATTHVDEFVTRKARPPYLEFFQGGCLIRSGSGNWAYQLSKTGSDTELTLQNIDAPTTDVHPAIVSESRRWGYGSIYKKIYGFSINIRKQLIIYDRLLWHQSDTLTILSGRTEAGAIKSEMFRGSEHRFADGSSITQHPDGMLCFQSSNNAIEPFYMPTVFSKNLGAAYDRYYAGANYFQRGDAVKQQKIHMSRFYNTYFQAFIDVIVRFATRS